MEGDAANEIVLEKDEDVESIVDDFDTDSAVLEHVFRHTDLASMEPPPLPLLQDFLKTASEHDLMVKYMLNPMDQQQRLQELGELYHIFQERCREATQEDCDYEIILTHIAKAIEVYAQSSEGLWFHEKIEQKYDDILDDSYYDFLNCIFPEPQADLEEEEGPIMNQRQARKYRMRKRCNNFRQSVSKILGIKKLEPPPLKSGPQKTLVLRKVEIRPDLTTGRPGDLKIECVQAKAFLGELENAWIRRFQKPTEGVDIALEFKRRGDFEPPPKKRKKVDWTFARHAPIQSYNRRNYLSEKSRGSPSDSKGVSKSRKDGGHKKLNKAESLTAIQELDSELNRLKKVLNSVHSKKAKLEKPSRHRGTSRFVPDLPTITEEDEEKDKEALTELKNLIKKISSREAAADRHAPDPNTKKFKPILKTIKEDEENDPDLDAIRRILDEITTRAGLGPDEALHKDDAVKTDETVLKETKPELDEKEEEKKVKSDDKDKMIDPDLEELTMILEKIKSTVAKARGGGRWPRPEQTLTLADETLPLGESERRSDKGSPLNADGVSTTSGGVSKDRAGRKRKVTTVKSALKHSRPYIEQCDYCMHDVASCACSIQSLEKKRAEPLITTKVKSQDKEVVLSYKFKDVTPKADQPSQPLWPKHMKRIDSLELYPNLRTVKSAKAIKKYQETKKNRKEAKREVENEERLSLAVSGFYTTSEKSVKKEKEKVVIKPLPTASNLLVLKKDENVGIYCKSTLHLTLLLGIFCTVQKL